MRGQGVVGYRIFPVPKTFGASITVREGGGDIVVLAGLVLAIFTTQVQEIFAALQQMAGDDEFHGMQLTKRKIF